MVYSSRSRSLSCSLSRSLAPSRSLSLSFALSRSLALSLALSLSHALYFSDLSIGTHPISYNFQNLQLYLSCTVIPSLITLARQKMHRQSPTSDHRVAPRVNQTVEAFYVAGPILWCSYPDNVESEGSLSLRAHMKTQLFDVVFIHSAPADSFTRLVVDDFNSEHLLHIYQCIVLVGHCDRADL